jgi:hypothetical protein
VLKRKPSAQFHAPSGFGRNGPPDRSRGRDRFDGRDIRVVQQVDASRMNHMDVRVFFVVWLKVESAA